MIKRIFTLLLTLALTLGTFSYLAAYANDTDSSASLPVISTLGDLPEWNEPTVTDSGYLLSYRGDTPLHSTALTDAYLRGEKKGGTRDILPARYDGREYGYLPAELRDQGGFGSCWAHGALASVETYMIKHGVTDGATGRPAATDIDLSEYALVSFTYNKAYDKLGMTEGDETYPIGEGDPDNYCVKLDTGGYAELAGYTLMRWEGAAPESVSALSYGSITPYGPAPSYAWQYDSVHVQGFTTVPTENAEQVKRMLMEYGAGAIAFYYDNEYYNADTSSYYDPDHTATNHAVTLVGWDDDYPAENFLEGKRPSGNGAWIIRNSWGDDWGDGGYFYLSYEDAGSLSFHVTFFDVEPADNFDNVYQYDGTGGNGYGFTNVETFSNTFIANGDELLEAIAIQTEDENTHYRAWIYFNPFDVDEEFTPDCGVLASEISGTIPYCGYHTVRLDTPVTLTGGQVYSVVVEFTLDEGNPWVPIDYSLEWSWIGFKHVVAAGRSFFKQNGSWNNYTGPLSFRIKAYTKDLKAKEETALSLYVDGQPVETHTGEVGSLYNLPTSAPSPDGYRFIGWSEGRFVDVNAEPRYYLPGETVLMSPSLTSLFALYVTDINESTVFTRIGNVPDGWEGKYVLTSTPDENGFVLGGVKTAGGSKVKVYDHNSVIGETGIVIDGASMTGVAQDQIYKIGQRYGFLTIRNALYGAYLEPVEGDLHLRGSFMGSANGWTLSPGDGDLFVIRAADDEAGGEKPYIGLNGDGRIDVSDTPQVYLWRAEEDYRTEPIPALPHMPGDINGDGENGTGDAVRMMKNLSGVLVTGNPYALDVNGDGAFDLKDLVRLLKFLSGANVDIY